MFSKLKSIVARIWDQIFTIQTLVAIFFVTGLILFEGFVLPVSYRRYLNSLRVGEYVQVVSAVLVILATLTWSVIFFRVSFVSSYPVRIICFAIFVVAVLFEYGYHNAFGHFSTVEDLRIAIFDATLEQWDGSISTYLNLLAVLPCVIYLALLLIFSRQRKSSWKVLPILFLVLAAFYGVLSPFIAGDFSTISSSAFFRTVLLSPFKWGSSYRGPREKIAVRDYQPQRNIILIVDESVRGDHLSVNGYERQTAPYLQQLHQQGWLQTWGTAAAGATCSKAASDLLLVGMGPTDLPNNENQIWKRPSIFQYAKAMGYRTYFIDGQSKTSWLGTSFDKNYIDTWMTPLDFQGDPNDRDAVIGKRISEILADSVGNFIWLSKRGIHYPYTRNFPASEVWWKPSLAADETQIDPARKEELINSYDNALRFNLEAFFRAVDPTRWDNNVFAVYTSDHGQTLSEHGERHTHCGKDMDTASTEAAVPLLMITKAPVIVDTKFLASHVNIFTTLLDLMEFPQIERPHPYALSLLEAKASQSQTRYFSVGDPRKAFFNRRIVFDH